jgi:hypothetical protein
MRRVTLAALVALSAFLATTDARPSDVQAQLTIFARPAVVGWAQPAIVFGAARGAGPQDVVTVQVRECGSSAFSTYAEAHVNAGGGWELPVGTAVTSTFRARWRSSTSAPVTIRQAASVLLARERAGRGLVVTAISKRSLWRRTVEIQRRQAGSWRTVREVRLTDSVKSTGLVSASEARFALAVPRGTPLRAVLAAAQAAPCYVRSVSRVVRT